MSALASALTALFTFLITVRTLRRWWPEDKGPVPARRLACEIGGLVAAFFIAFSNSFWDSAIEAEVYSLSSFLLIFTVWLAFNWWDHLGETGNDRLLVLIVYLLSISSAVHLGTVLVAPGLLVLFAIARPNYFKTGKFWASAALLGGFVLFLWVNEFSADVDVPVALILTLLAALVAVYALNHKKLVKHNLFTWWMIALLVGFTVQSEPSRRVYAEKIPFVLLAFGAWWNWKRDKKTFWFFLTQNVVMGPALIFYLNFTDHEVRERDYFFTNSYHFLAIWMGMGAAGVLEWIARALEPARARAVAPAAVPGEANGRRVPSGLAATFGGERSGFWIAALALIGISLLPLKDGWYEHDRSGFYIAHDYAYNMLAPLAPNAIVITNGDNDTFPLWYIQEVEKVRKDVRVVNLSLLNTPWYIKQLRDQEPRVPFTFTDAQLDQMQPYQDEKTGKIIWVKDQAIADMVKVNGWRKPIYMAVTVPEQLGFDQNGVLEGLVFRISPKPVGDHVVDVNKTLYNLYHVFRYGGLLNKNRDYDRSVYKDDNAYKLVQNYSAAHVQAAYQLQQQGRSQEALNILRDAVKMTPDFPGLLEYLGKSYQDLGDTAAAERVFAEAQKRFPTSAEFYYHLGTIHWQRGHKLRNPMLIEQGIQELRRACSIDQRYFDWFGALFSALWLEGRKQEGVDVLRTWARAHPEDPQGAAWLKAYEDSLRISAAPRSGAGTRAAGGVR